MLLETQRDRTLLRARRQSFSDQEVRELVAGTRKGTIGPEIEVYKREQA